MKLTLVNFRSFANAEFNFDSNYMLISGQSGSGKTSIFMAIQFALTGQGRKVVTRGKTKCRVELSDDTMSIVRTKGPCRLVVVVGGTQYEDDSAQAMIDSAYRNWEMGYVAQQVYRSFVMMTPADKLSLIESISECNVDSINTRCKNLISERKNALESIVSQKSTVTSMLEDMGVAIVESRDDSRELNRELDRLQIVQREINDRLAVERSIRDRIERNTLELNQLSVDDDDDIPDLDELIRQTDEYKKFVDLDRRLDRSLPYSEIAESDIDRAVDDMKQLQMLTSKIEPLDRLRLDLDKIESVLRLNTVAVGKCPSCRIMLSKRRGELIVGPGSTTVDETEKYEMKRIQLMEQIKQLESYKSQRDAIASRYEPGIDHAGVLQYMLRVKSNDRVWEAMKNEFGDEVPAKPVHDINSVVNRIRTRDRIESIKNELQSDMERLRNTGGTGGTIEVAEEIDRIRALLKSIEYSDQWKRVRDLNERQMYFESKIPVACRLQSLIKSAERVAVEDTLANINFRVGIYMDRFFDSPTSAELVFEPPKKGISQPKIDLKITMDYGETDISSLSGGELARVVLAFAITMAEINNVKMLLLDESFASLDALTTSNVMDAIRDNFDGQIIVVAHQTTKGVFDKVIELE